ncbi:MAG TPA: acyl-CoA ligase (AMP-forming), exosortase A system-associated [Candidatus Eisenbacteria bacterium]|nr:acyl-CoA ligase (AMP-forming), exosortase A system-associated [Candidatus Eisenbacteria bacterium]
MDFLIHHMLRASAARLPQKEALVHGDRRLSYAEVWAQVRGLAAGLRRGGLERSDRVGIFLDASVEQSISIFGVSRAECVFVPINGVLLEDQVAHIARDCRMRCLITSAAKLALIAPALASIPTLERLVVVGGGAPAGVTLPADSYEALVAEAPAADPPEPSIEKDLAAILYTSGSTGKPKGVMLSHAQVMAGAHIVATYLEITESERILAVLPFSFDAGMNQIMTAFLRGATIVLKPFVFAREIVTALKNEKITGLAGVPTLWSLLAQPSSSLAKGTYPHLRYITNTGGVMPQDVLATLRAALPSTRVFLMYGLTEAFRSTYLPPSELDRRPTSMGKAIPDTEILVVDENGRRCGPGETGELVHRGPTVSMGYWGQPELTAKVLRPHPFLPPELGDTERVCYSGDLVKMDEDGFLYFIGRRDNMIKSSGYRISPTEVEEVLFQSGMVQLAAVIGVPDAMLGAVVHAFVVPTEGGTFDQAALQAYCAAKMPPYMLPKTIEVLDQLPKTSSGKVDYPALRRRTGG